MKARELIDVGRNVPVGKGTYAVKLIVDQSGEDRGPLAIQVHGWIDGKAVSFWAHPDAEVET
jgi:hypothetical protein